MQMVAEHELQGALSWLQFDHGLGLAATEMDVAFIGGDRDVHRWEGVHVDQEVVMAGVRHIHAGRRDALALEPETDRNRTGDDVAVLWADEINAILLGQGRRRRRLR